MMKKIAAIFVALCLTISGLTAYAAKPSTAGANAKGKVNEVQTFKKGVDALKPLQDTIKANEQAIKELRESAKKAIEAVKVKLETLKEQKDKLTPVQIEKIKQMLTTVKESQKLLAGTLGNIEAQSVELRTSKKNRDTTAYAAALSNIIAVQNTRKANLLKLATDMNSLLQVQI